MLRYGGEGKAEAEEEKVEEVKAEINYLLSGNRENDVATAQRFFTSPPFSGSLFPLALAHEMAQAVIKRRRRAT